MMQTNRAKFKNIQTKVEFLELPLGDTKWLMEDDVPKTWEESELKQMRFRCSRKNYLAGYMDKTTYEKEVKLYRDTNAKHI